MKKCKEKNGVLVIQRFKNSQKITILLSIIFFIILILYIISLVLLQIDTNTNSNLLSEKMTILLNILKDFFLIIISIIGTTLLTATIIEKNQKNTTYTELLANDIFASPEFYSNLSDENKYKMIENLERNYYKHYVIKQELYNIFRDKLNHLAYEYYYEECNYNISFFPKQGYTEKVIVRTMKIRSYSDNTAIPHLHLCGYSLSPFNENFNSDDELSEFELDSISIDNIIHNPMESVSITPNATTDQLLNKCGYSVSYSVDLKNEIVLSSKKDTIISIEYKSRVTDYDNSASFRVNVPCRKYILNFTAPENYKVIAHAFGTFDVASNSSNSKFDNTIAVEFDNWLLPENGITICCIEKKQPVTNNVNKKLLYK